MFASAFHYKLKKKKLATSFDIFSFFTYLTNLSVFGIYIGGWMSHGQWRKRRGWDLKGVYGEAETFTASKTHHTHSVRVSYF